MKREINIKIRKLSSVMLVVMQTGAKEEVESAGGKADTTGDRAADSPQQAHLGRQGQEAQCSKGEISGVVGSPQLAPDLLNPDPAF